MLSKKLKRYDTNKVLLSAIYNFGNFDIRIEGVKSFRTKQLLTRYVVC